MTPEDRRALRIARDALDLDTTQRNAFVNRECSGEDGLRQRVEAFLRNIDAIESESPPPMSEDETLPDAGGDALIGTRLGPFRIVERIGRGGTGVVYRCEREDGGFEQTVAIKLIRRGLDFDEVRARFLRERRILARLNHPNLARFIDGGVSDHGRPWFALEYVRGQPVTRWCDERRLDLRSRIRLFLDVCAAVQYAHTQLVVHRDLKPGNILVDENGKVRLLDFGIAQLLFDQSGEKAAATTIAGYRGFTPEYAAPEQFVGAATGVASDIYSLGCVAYELVSGVLPREIPRNRVGPLRPPTSFPLQSLTQAIVRGPKSTASPSGQPVPQDGGTLAGETGNPSDETRSPDHRLSVRSVSLRGYRTQVRGDLSRILETALADEPEHRYATVDALADDLQRWLDGAPVRVSGRRLGYRIGKFVRRHRLPLALLCACLMLAVAGVVGIVWQARQATEAATRAVAVKTFLADLLTNANPFIKPGDTPTVRDLLDEAGKRIESKFAGQPALAAELLGVVGTSYRGLGELALADRYLGHAIALSEDAPLDARVLGDLRAEYLQILIGQSKPAEAIRLGREALAALPAEETELRAEILIGIATALRFEDDAAGALSAAKEGVDLACAGDGSGNPLCIQTLIELKYFHEFAGDTDAALAAAREAWERCERLHGDDPNPQRVQAAGAYGTALAAKGSYDEAIGLLRRTVDLARAIYGEDNFRYARALDWLAMAYDDADRVPEALATTEQAFAIGHATLPRSPLAAFWLQRMARLQLDLRQPGAAEASLAKLASHAAGNLSAQLVDGIDVVRLRLRLMTQTPSRALAGDAAALADRLAAASSPMGIAVDLFAAEACLDAGDVAQASRLLDRYASRTPAPKNMTQLGWSQLLRARLLSLQDDAEASASMLRTARATLEAPSASGSRHALVLHGLGRLQCRAGNRSEARALFAQARAYWHDHVDATHTPADLDDESGCGGPSSS